jgi:hypothetical protein
MRYRSDRSETNAAGQVTHYAVWMGGPTVSKIEGARCPDGKNRTAFVSGEADTFFSLPAYVHHKSRRIKGFLTITDGVWAFHSTELAPHEVLPNYNNVRVKVGQLVFNEDRDIARVIGFVDRDGMGVKYPIPRLLVLQLNRYNSGCYVRHWEQADVIDTIAPVSDGGAFIAWFMGGELAPAEELIKQEAFGALNSTFFSRYCRPDGGAK